MILFKAHLASTSNRRRGSRSIKRNDEPFYDAVNCKWINVDFDCVHQQPTILTAYTTVASGIKVQQGNYYLSLWIISYEHGVYSRSNSLNTKSLNLNSSNFTAFSNWLFSNWLLLVVSTERFYVHTILEIHCWPNGKILQQFVYLERLQPAKQST